MKTTKQEKEVTKFGRDEAAHSRRRHKPKRQHHHREEMGMATALRHESVATELPQSPIRLVSSKSGRKSGNATATIVADTNLEVTPRHLRQYLQLAQVEGKGFNVWVGQVPTKQTVSDESFDGINPKLAHFGGSIGKVGIGGSDVSFSTLEAFARGILEAIEAGRAAQIFPRPRRA